MNGIVTEMLVDALLGIARGAAALLGIILCLLLFIFIYDRIRKASEKKLLRPLGKLVDAGGTDGGRMCVYTEDGPEGAENDAAFVFMAGSGIVSPLLDMRSLYSQFSGSRRIAVPEGMGRGFSDDTEKSRDIDTLLAETRAALRAAGVGAPYILFPHGDAGIEALYWAKKYPDEIKAVIGLDMSVPSDIKEARASGAGLFRAARISGILRFLVPSILSEHLGSLLTDEELAVYEALICRRVVSDADINKSAAALSNAKKAADAGRPYVPMLLFVSDGTYTGYDGDAWLASKEEYIKGSESARVIPLACDHSVHNFEYRRIAEETGRFLEGAEKVNREQ